MRTVLQRVTSANVKVDGKVVGEIKQGLMILVGFTEGDSSKEIDYSINKIINMRIFDDENGVMNKSLLDIKGEILSISQFTLYADPTTGRRPSWNKALKSDKAIVLYEEFNKKLKETGVHIETGIFGADMKVSLTNDGPVTILLESD